MSEWQSVQCVCTCTSAHETFPQSDCGSAVLVVAISTLVCFFKLTIKTRSACALLLYVITLTEWFEFILCQGLAQVARESVWAQVASGAPKECGHKYLYWRMAGQQIVDALESR
eukprot:GHUV01028302.1.p1 GENE.GHUV01028302.1~~GHUV01028302.1.p1  ORF type:complete len:114 (+),score=0.64 GHUV01028302.1:625-966(+)